MKGWDGKTPEPSPALVTRACELLLAGYGLYAALHELYSDFHQPYVGLRREPSGFLLDAIRLAAKMLAVSGKLDARTFETRSVWARPA